jgi:hypothetical protein
MLATFEFGELTWSSVTGTSPISSTNGALIPSTAVGIPSVFAVGTQNYTMSNFGPTTNPVGVATKAVIGGVQPPLPVVVQADYSCWCPALGIFVRPEDTTLMTKLSE